MTSIPMTFTVTGGLLTTVLLMDIIPLLLIPVNALMTIGIHFMRIIQEEMSMGI